MSTTDLQKTENEKEFELVRTQIEDVIKTWKEIRNVDLKPAMEEELVLMMHKIFFQGQKSIIHKLNNPLGGVDETLKELETAILN